MSYYLGTQELDVFYNLGQYFKIVSNLNASTNDLLGTNCVRVCVTLYIGKKTTLRLIFGLCLRYLEKTNLSYSKVTPRMAEVKDIVIFYNRIKIYHKLHFCFAFKSFCRVENSEGTLLYGKFLVRKRPLNFLISNEAQRLGVINQLLIQMLDQYVKISINHQTFGLPNQGDKASWFASVAYNFRSKIITFFKNSASWGSQSIFFNSSSKMSITLLYHLWPTQDETSIGSRNVNINLEYLDSMGYDSIFFCFIFQNGMWPG